MFWWWHDCDHDDDFGYIPTGRDLLKMFGLGVAFLAAEALVCWWLIVR